LGDGFFFGREGREGKGNGKKRVYLGEVGGMEGEEIGQIGRKKK